MENCPRGNAFPSVLKRTHDIGADFDGVFATSPGNAVGPVKIGIAELVGAFGVGAKTAEAGKPDDAGNAVLERSPVGADLQTKLSHHIVLRLEAGIERVDVMEIVEAEAGLVYQVRRNDP